jgi:hypothetical protein
MRMGSLAVLLALTAPAVAGGRPGVAPPASPTTIPQTRATKVAGVNCPEAGRAVVSVPAGFDGVRVVVADTLPGAAVDVTVMAGAADRRVRARGGGAWSLFMDEAPSGPVLVSIEPSLDTPVGACVERVELLRDSRVVADVRLFP